MLYKKFLKFIFALLIFSLSSAAAKAVDFTLKIGNPADSYTFQNEVYIPITAEKISQYNFLKPFRLELNYNHDVFDFKKFECNFPFSENDFKINQNDSSLNILSNFQKIINLPFQNRKFFLGNIIFSVKECAQCGEHLIECLFTQNQFYNKTIKSNANVRILSAQKSFSSEQPNHSKLNSEIINKQKNKPTGKLKSLNPEIGTLSPAFNPDVFEYSIDVDENVQYLEFEAVPQENDSVVKINRRKLRAAGNTTVIKIMVSNKNGKILYIVNVNRSAKSNSGSARSNKNSSSSKNSEKSSKKRKHKRKNNKFELSDDFDDSDNDFDEYDEEDDEETEDENPDKNQIINDENNSKTYLIIIFGAIILLCGSYYTYKFIKQRRKNSKNTKNPLNKPLE